MPSPIIIVWSLYNSLIAWRASRLNDNAAFATIVVLIIGAMSLLLLGFGHLNMFMYYEIGVCLFHISTSLLLPGEGEQIDARGRDAVIISAFLRTYLAGGVWLALSSGVF